jgi:Na+/proline symporter
MAWNLLFTSDIGLLSLFTILFILVMAVYIGFYAMKQANKEEASHGGRSQPGTH